MFDSIGWGEIAVLALAALLIFGPDRLPSVAHDAASALRRARSAATGLRGQIDDGLADDFAALHAFDLGRYRPKELIREHLLGTEDAPLADDRHPR